MKKHLTAFILLISFWVQSQKINPETIPLSKNPTNSELQFLKEELKDVQVVLLGENTHFDGNVFEYRNKIINYLVGELGFTTIAFESGVYDVCKVNREVEKGENVSFALQNGLMGHWSQAKEFHQLFDVIKKFNLKMYGFDNQIHSSYAKKYFIEDFKKFLYENKIKTRIDKLFIEQLKSVVFAYKFDVKLYDYDDFQNKISSILKEITSKPKRKKLIYWSRIIKGFSKITEDVFKIPKEPVTPFVLNKADKIRDQQMAENLLEYIKENPAEKIICLGANGHFINDLSKVEEPLLKNIRPMGSYLKETLKDKIYTLAFITSCIKKTAPNSVEDYINKSSDEHLFFSTHQKEFEKPLLNCFVSNGKFIKSKISDFFDACITFKKCEDYQKGTLFKSSKTTTYELKGRLIDKKSQEPIAFAQVTIPNSSVSSFTDDKGNYRLIIPKKTTFSKLKITNIGFEDVFVNFKPILKLSFKEKVNVLDEVVVNSKKTGKGIVESAVKKKWKNHLHKKVYFNRACEVIYKEGDSLYLGFGFNVADLNRPVFRYWKTIDEIKLIYNKGFEKKDSITNLPFYRTAFKFSVLEKNRLDKYKFHYEKDTVFNDEQAYKVTFSTLKQSENIATNCSGALYISKKTEAFLKIKHEHKWETIKYDTKKLARYWYVPKNKRKNRNISYWQTTFNFKKDENLKLYLYDNIVTEWLGHYTNSEGKETKLYTRQNSVLKKVQKK